LFLTIRVFINMGDKKKGFVYVWENLNNGKKYIGYHVGNLDDDYVSSSHNDNFWKDFYDSGMTWNRKIVFTGDSESSLLYEQTLLENIDISSDEYYNNARGSKIIFTEEILKKMSDAGKKRWKNMSKSERKKRNKKISESKKGIPRDKETILKLRNFYKNENYIGIIHKDIYRETQEKIIKSNTGKIRTEEFKNEQSIRFSGEKNPMFGKKRTNEFKEARREYFNCNNPGKNKTDETREKISESKKGIPSKVKGIPRNKVKCPHCDKVGGTGIMNRWHFNNCKHKKNGW